MNKVQLYQNGPKMGITLFSLTLEWLSKKYTLAALLHEVSNKKLGPGVELVGFQSIKGFPIIDTNFAKSFRDTFDKFELIPTCLGLNVDIALNPKQKLSENELIDYLSVQIKAASILGFSIVRSQMTAKASIIEKLIPVLEKYNIKLGNEIHSPYTLSNPDVIQLKEMYDKVQSPYLGYIPDFANSAHRLPAGFLQRYIEDGVPEKLVRLVESIWYLDLTNFEKFSLLQEEGRKMGGTAANLGRLNMVLTMFSRMEPEEWLSIMPQVIHVHGKFYAFDKDGNEPSINYEKLISVFKDGGYNGFISSEWEGHIYTDKVSGFEMVSSHHNLCNRYL